METDSWTHYKSEDNSQQDLLLIKHNSDYGWVALFGWILLNSGRVYIERDKHKTTWYVRFEDEPFIADSWDLSSIIAHEPYIIDIKRELSMHKKHLYLNQLMKHPGKKGHHYGHIHVEFPKLPATLHNKAP